MLLFRPSASPAIVGVNGSPEEACSTVPIRQPSAAALNGRHPSPGLGNSHVPLIDRFRGASKSDGPFVKRGSKTGRLESVFVYAVMSEFDPVSRLFDQV
jgi:hypothetical protein